MVLKRGAENLSRAPSEYLRDIWFDTVSPWPAAVRYGLEMVGPDQLMFASDHPWVDPGVIVPIVDALPVSDEERARIYGGNAAKLFRINSNETS
jgi:predicted TIM-barrel fold metal-dependent hydrolase